MHIKTYQKKWPKGEAQQHLMCWAAPEIIYKGMVIGISFYLHIVLILLFLLVISYIKIPPKSTAGKNKHILFKIEGLNKACIINILKEIAGLHKMKNKKNNSCIDS